MIIYDFSAHQQNLDQLMNRHAMDYVDYREDRQKKERGISYEDFIGVEVAPRRSPWRTADEDIAAARPAVSREQMPATVQNISRILFTQPVTSVAPAASSGGITASDVLRIISSPEVTQQLTQTVLNNLPIVEFKCP